MALSQQFVILGVGTHSTFLLRRVALCLMGQNCFPHLMHDKTKQTLRQDCFPASRGEGALEFRFEDIGENALKGKAFGGVIC